MKNKVTYTEEDDKTIINLIIQHAGNNNKIPYGELSKAFPDKTSHYIKLKIKHMR